MLSFVRLMFPDLALLAGEITNFKFARFKASVPVKTEPLFVIVNSGLLVRT